MGSSGRLSEKTIRELSTAKSFERGRDLYSQNAIADTYRQGNTLFATCEGSSAPFYNLRAVIAGGEVVEAACDCPYDFGGICKHLIALLLTYIHAPEQFEERLPLRDLVKDLDRDALVSLLERLASANPDLYDRIVSLTARTPASAKAAANAATTQSLSEISDKSYRRQIKSILRGPLSARHSDQYWMTGRMVAELDELHSDAVNSLEAEEPAIALMILMVLLEETGAAYEMLDDSDGEIANFLDEVSESLSEAILSQGLSDEDREMLEKRLKPLADDLLEYGVEGPSMAMDALDQGWGAALSLEDDGDEPSDLTDIKLNILERQGRSDDFLALCLAEGRYLRYCTRLLDLGRKDEAMRVAIERLDSPAELYFLAQQLEHRGDVSAAIAVGERGLSMPQQSYHLSRWLAPLAEASGRMELALQAYGEVFQDLPSLEVYKKLQALAGDRWERLKPDLMRKLSDPFYAGVLLDVYLDERNWDAAIQLADYAGNSLAHRLPQLAELVLEIRPDWVIRAGKAQADDWIARGSGKAYAVAASWLRVVKRAYTVLGKSDEWLAYLHDLKLQYPRRRVLQAELSKL